MNRISFYTLKVKPTIQEPYINHSRHYIEDAIVEEICKKGMTLDLSYEHYVNKLIQLEQL